MAYGTTRPLLTPAVLIFGLLTAACGAASPTAPAAGPVELGAGSFQLTLYGTATCTTANGANGGVPAAASIAVELMPGATPGTWQVSAPGQSLIGEVGLAGDTVEGYVRGSALTQAVRVTTGTLPDETVAFSGGRNGGQYTGSVLAGTPRFEGLGPASGSVTTCAANGFTLSRP